MRTDTKTKLAEAFAELAALVAQALTEAITEAGGFFQAPEATEVVTLPPLEDFAGEPKATAKQQKAEHLAKAKAEREAATEAAPEVVVGRTIEKGDLVSLDKSGKLKKATTTLEAPTAEAILEAATDLLKTEGPEALKAVLAEYGFNRARECPEAKRAQFLAALALAKKGG